MRKPQPKPASDSSSTSYGHSPEERGSKYFQMLKRPVDNLGMNPDEEPIGGTFRDFDGQMKEAKVGREGGRYILEGVAEGDGSLIYDPEAQTVTIATGGETRLPEDKEVLDAASALRIMAQARAARPPHPPEDH